VTGGSQEYSVWQARAGLGIATVSGILLYCAGLAFGPETYAARPECKPPFLARIAPPPTLLPVTLLRAAAHVA
jgi:hypothetical protein